MGDILEELIFLTIVCVLLSIAPLMILTAAIRNFIRQNERNKKRRIALNMVKPYLASYSDLWKNQMLSNGVLKAELGYIIVYLTGDGMLAKLNLHKKANTEIVWDLILSRFSATINYETMLQSIKEYCRQNNIDADIAEKQIAVKIKLDDMIDVNNCSELELTKLKGINIAIAKRIVNKRKEIGGFSTKEEFLEFINLKPHQLELIKDYIKIRRAAVVKVKRKFFERHIDL